MAWQFEPFGFRLWHGSFIGLRTGRSQTFRMLSVAFASLCLLNLVAMTGAMGNSVKFGKYSEFTLYNADEGALKEEIILVFHGFKSAMPNGAYKRLSNALRERFSVIGFNYDYFDIEANNEAFEEAWVKFLKGRKIIAAGTSLGGFWANYYAHKYAINRVMVVNPVTDPVNQLRQFIGRHFVEKRQQELVVTASDIERYRGLEIPVDEKTERLVLLTRDDEILDYHLAAEKYSGRPKNQVFIFDQGGHTVNLREPRFMDRIKQFLQIAP